LVKVFNVTLIQYNRKEKNSSVFVGFSKNQPLGDNCVHNWRNAWFL